MQRLWNACERLPMLMEQQNVEHLTWTKLFPDAANNAASPLTDYIRPGLNLVFVGINPGTQSARHGRHYAGPNNAFCMLPAELVVEVECQQYQCLRSHTTSGISPSMSLLYESRLVTEPLTLHAASGIPPSGPLLYESRLVTEPLTFAEDERVLEWNIGLTNIVERSTPSSQDLSRYVRCIFICHG